MAGRTSEKDEEISKEWEERNYWWERSMRKARNTLIGPIFPMSTERRPRCEAQSCNPLKCKCVICGCRLMHEFPEDFPEEWKFCCWCLNIAKNIVNNGFPMNVYNNGTKIIKYITWVK